MQLTLNLQPFTLNNHPQNEDRVLVITRDGDIHTATYYREEKPTPKGRKVNTYERFFVDSVCADHADDTYIECSDVIGWCLHPDTQTLIDFHPEMGS